MKPSPAHDTIQHTNVMIDHRSWKLSAAAACARTTGDRWPLKPLGEVAPIIDAGGIFSYAKKVGMLPG